MDHTKPLALFCLICLALATSCKKDHHAPPQQALDSFRLDLNFPVTSRNYNPYGNLNYYELIVSEGGGRIVLDTLADYNAPVITWLKTNQKLLDVTIVQQVFNSINTVIHTYKAIDLTAWTNIPDNDSAQYPAGGSTAPTPLPTVVNYSGVNVPPGSYYNILENGIVTNGQAYNTTFYDAFTSWAGVYVYLIFPDLGLYNIHQVASQSDMVDLSHPDTAVNVLFNRPAIYTTSSFSIVGYPDTNNLETGFDLTYRTPPGAQLITDATNMYYPGRKGFKKYFFAYSAADANNTNSASVNLPWVDTVPANIVIPDPTWCSVTQTADTGVSVQFNKTSPTYYNLVITTPSYTQFTMTAPADSTSLHPVAFYRALNSKMLGSFDYTQLQFSSIYMEINAQPDYRTYWVGKSQIYKAYAPGSPAYTTFQHRF